MTLTQSVENLLRQTLAAKPELNNALRLLSKWRSVLIQNTLLQHHPDGHLGVAHGANAVAGDAGKGRHASIASSRFSSPSRDGSM